jgi:hypothetical protein
MENFLKTKFPYYNGDITDSKVVGYVSLEAFVKAHKAPTNATRTLINSINNCKDKSEKNELKKYLNYFTPSVYILINSRRQYKNVKSFTGLVQIDFDGVDDVEDLKTYLSEEYEQFVCLYSSPSGKGLKGIMRIPIVETIEEYRLYYNAIADELDWIYGFDIAPKNAVLPLYISYDENLYFNPQATIWDRKLEIDTTDHESLGAIPTPEREGDETVYKSNAYFGKISKEIFSRKINNIVDNGHPQLRSACVVIGGRVGAGYLSVGDAESLAEQMIRSNNYLQKGIENYIKTSKWAIARGVEKPIYYD